MKITDPKVLHELYEVEADWKLLIGYRFKGCLPAARKVNGSSTPAKRRPPVSSKHGKRAAAAR
jgi:hypothetical protein